MESKNMPTNEFLNSISEEKVGFFPQVKAQATGGSYFKVNQIGQALPNPSKVRILGAFTDGTMIEGYRAFINNKPIRRKTLEEIPLSELGTNQFGQQEKPVLFWAFPVFVFDETNVQVCEIHQFGLMRELERLGNNPSWGDPRLFNVSIMKTGAGSQTAYQLTPTRDSFPQEHAESAGLAADSIDLTKLFEGEDPFLSSSDSAPAQ